MSFWSQTRHCSSHLVGLQQNPSGSSLQSISSIMKLSTPKSLTCCWGMLLWTSHRPPVKQPHRQEESKSLTPRPPHQQLSQKTGTVILSVSSPIAIPFQITSRPFQITRKLFLSHKVPVPQQVCSLLFFYSTEILK